MSSSVKVRVPPFRTFGAHEKFPADTASLKRCLSIPAISHANVPRIFSE